MLVHSADTQEAATLARTEQLDACPDHFDWIDCHAVNAIRAVRGITAKPEENDAAIISAWERRLAAFDVLQELPDNPQGEGETPERAAQWAIVDAAEAEIQSAVACTPRGAELQIWTSVTFLFDSAEDEAPCYRADFDYFAAKGDALDWTERLLLAAIRSLRAMGGAK
jgi:hypothetical protein